MTIATTVLGSLLMACGLGDGADIFTPMAITVICGLTTSTVFTRFVIPTTHFLVDGLWERSFKTPTPAPASGEPLPVK